MIFLKHAQARQKIFSKQSNSSVLREILLKLYPILFFNDVTTDGCQRRPLAVAARPHGAPFVSLAFAH